jgi:cytochrome d ubiquinol oxidase subunit I
VSSLSTGEVIASLAAFWLVYLGLFGAWVRQIVRAVRAGPDALPGQQGSEPALRDAAAAPAPAGASAGTSVPVTPAEA